MTAWLVLAAALQLLNSEELVRLKEGVVLADILMEGAIKVEEALHITAPDVDCVITSGTDGRHGENSLHYKGLALDFRTRDLTLGQQKIWLALCEEKLGEDWDIVLEKDHMHVEYDEK